MMNLREQIKAMENHANQVEKMVRLDFLPGQHYEVEASDEGVNDPPAILGSVLEGMNPEAKWCLGFNPCEFSEPCGKESSSDGAAAGTWVKFKFTRPFQFRGYSFKLGNDCPERDPMYWKVVVKDSQANVNRLVDEYHHCERHDGSIMGDEPERLTVHKYVMKKVIFTDEVTFRFGALRDPGCDCFQLSKIFFYC